jgi:hypothetical protein
LLFGSARLDESRLEREYDDLHSVSQIELAKDVVHVGLDRPLAEEERVGDLCVRETARDQFQDVELSLCEVLELGRRRTGARAADELLDKPAGDGWRQERFAAGDYRGRRSNAGSAA